MVMVHAVMQLPLGRGAAILDDSTRKICHVAVKTAGNVFTKMAGTQLTYVIARYACCLLSEPRHQNSRRT